MRRYLLLLFLVCLSAGCSQGQTTRTEGDVRIWLHESGFATGGEDALVGGTMTYDRSTRCMYLELDDRLYPVIWPTGTRIEDVDPVAIRSKGESIMEGDSVSGGGGYHPPGRFQDLIPKECHGTTGEVAQFNADSRIEVNRP